MKRIVCIVLGLVMLLTIANHTCLAARKYPIVLKQGSIELDCMNNRGSKPEGDPMLLTLEENSKVRCKVVGTKKKITWYSSNKKVATVTKTGKIVCKRKGSCTIKAKVKGIKNKLVVYVQVE